MSDRIRVGDDGTFEDGESRIVEADSGISIGVFNIDGEYHALLNTCLHQNGPVCEGGIEREVVGDWDGPGERVREQYTDRSVVKCPWHGWEYDIETGQLLRDDSMQLPTFDVVVEDGDVYVQM